MKISSLEPSRLHILMNCYFERKNREVAIRFAKKIIKLSDKEVLNRFEKEKNNTALSSWIRKKDKGNCWKLDNLLIFNKFKFYASKFCLNFMDLHGESKFFGIKYMLNLEDLAIYVDQTKPYRNIFKSLNNLPNLRNVSLLTDFKDSSSFPFDDLKCYYLLKDAEYFFRKNISFWILIGNHVPYFCNVFSNEQEALSHRKLTISVMNEYLFFENPSLKLKSIDHIIWNNYIVDINNFLRVFGKEKIPNLLIKASIESELSYYQIDFLNVSKEFIIVKRFFLNLSDISIKDSIPFLNKVKAEEFSMTAITRPIERFMHLQAYLAEVKKYNNIVLTTTGLRKSFTESITSLALDGANSQVFIFAEAFFNRAINNLSNFAWNYSKSFFPVEEFLFPFKKMFSYCTNPVCFAPVDNPNQKINLDVKIKYLYPYSSEFSLVSFIERIISKEKKTLTATYKGTIVISQYYNYCDENLLSRKEIDCGNLKITLNVYNSRSPYIFSHQLKKIMEIYSDIRNKESSEEYMMNEEMTISYLQF